MNVLAPFLTGFLFTLGVFSAVGVAVYLGLRWVRHREAKQDHARSTRG